MAEGVCKKFPLILFFKGWLLFDYIHSLTRTVGKPDTTCCRAIGFLMLGCYLQFPLGDGREECTSNQTTLKTSEDCVICKVSSTEGCCTLSWSKHLPDLKTWLGVEHAKIFDCMLCIGISIEQFAQAKNAIYSLATQPLLLISDKIWWKWCTKCHQLFSAQHFHWDFHWGNRKLHARFTSNSVLAKAPPFLGWAEFCQLLPSVKLTAFTEAWVGWEGGNASTPPSTRQKDSHLWNGVVFSQVFCWCILQIPYESVSLPAGGKDVLRALADCHPLIVPPWGPKASENTSIIIFTNNYCNNSLGYDIPLV